MGWVAYFTIPFSSLSLPQTPLHSTIWGLGVTMFDKDEQAKLPTRTVWPESMQQHTPTTWGEMAFGFPTFTRPASEPIGEVRIKNGINGASVPDAHVGGHTTCGHGIDHWSDGVKPTTPDTAKSTFRINGM